MAFRVKPSLNWLLVFLPVTVGLHTFANAAHAATFVCACIAIIPLAGLLGRATEHIADKTGEGIGGLLNATFGNAAELIIALAALREGLHDVVKASVTGSIIGNLLLVLGAAFLTGGLRYPTQKFNAVGARAQASSLTLAAIALILPAAFHYLGGSRASARESGLSLEISCVLLVTYGFSLWFSLKTHKHLFGEPHGEVKAVEGKGHRAWSTGRSVTVLAGSTVLVAWVSEILVRSVGPAAEAFGMTGVFVGVIVVAIIGNAAEHSTAILAAWNNRMDLAIGIAVGSSLQIALFVAPVLVLASYLLGPTPMDLVFTPAEVLAVVLSVAIANQVTGDGESNWLEGIQLLSVYLILAGVFYFLPA